MTFYTHLGKFQTDVAALSRSKINRLYKDFADALPETGLSFGKSFTPLPNFRRFISEEWKQLLIKAKDSLEKAVKFTETE
mmetsp:Transcript_25314/g.22434  ORF Transcript_25314/g.22434 Transcript_25314/m.22434 type:complete len:80 (-) Transcript_25314:229-468(-)